MGLHDHAFAAGRLGSRNRTVTKLARQYVTCHYINSPINNKPMIKKYINESTEAFIEEMKTPHTTEKEIMLASLSFKEGMRRAFIRVFEKSLYSEIDFQLQEVP